MFRQADLSELAERPQTEDNRGDAEAEDTSKEDIGARPVSSQQGRKEKERNVRILLGIQEARRIQKDVAVEKEEKPVFDQFVISHGQVSIHGVKTLESLWPDAHQFPPSGCALCCARLPSGRTKSALGLLA